MHSAPEPSFGASRPAEQAYMQCDTIALLAMYSTYQPFERTGRSDPAGDTHTHTHMHCTSSSIHVRRLPACERAWQLAAHNSMQGQERA